jgi:hypothetical protein
MTPTLVVVRPFGTHAKGDAIADAATVAQILATEHATKVVRVFATPTPASAQAPAAPQQGG